MTIARVDANFVDNPPSGTYVSVSRAGVATICVTRGAANSFGTDKPLRVRYEVVDDEGARSEQVTLTITPTLAVNGAPTAGANTMGFTFRDVDSVSVQKCNSINVLGNDSDPDGDSMTSVATGANFSQNHPTAPTTRCPATAPSASASPAAPPTPSDRATHSSSHTRPPRTRRPEPEHRDLDHPSLLTNGAPTSSPNAMGFTFRTSDANSVQKCNSINVLGNDSDPTATP